MSDPSHHFNLEIGKETAGESKHLTGVSGIILQGPIRNLPGIAKNYLEASDWFLLPSYRIMPATKCSNGYQLQKMASFQKYDLNICQCLKVFFVAYTTSFRVSYQWVFKLSMAKWTF